MADRATDKTKEAVEQTAETAKRVSEGNVEAFKRATDETTTTLRRVTEGAGEGYRELAEMGQGNIEAFIRSGRVVLEGWQEMNREFVSYAQAQLQENAEAGRAFARSRTVQDALQVQRDYVRASLEKFVDGATKLNDIATRVVNDSLVPLQARASQNAEQVSRNARV
jgi:phasin family protein